AAAERGRRSITDAADRLQSRSVAIGSGSATVRQPDIDKCISWGVHMHVITIAPFTASNALDGAFLKVIPPAYLTTARNLLKPHNITIEVLRTGIGDTPCVVTWDKAVDDEKNGGAL